MTWILTMVLVATGAVSEVPMPSQAKCEALAQTINAKDKTYHAECKEQK